MEPVNPLLPALRPDTPGLLRRASGMLEAVRGIQQEMNGDYWLNLAKNENPSDARAFYVTKSETLFLIEVKEIKIYLKSDEEKEQYSYFESDGESGGWAFDDELFYSSNKNKFDRLATCYEHLVELAVDGPSAAKFWLELAEFFEKYRIRSLARDYYRNAFFCERRLDVLLKEQLQLSGYSRNEWYGPWIIENLEGAIDLDEAIIAFPSHYDFYRFRAVKEFWLCNYHKSLSDLDKYIALANPTDPYHFTTIIQAYKWKGRAFHKLGDAYGVDCEANNVLRIGGRLDRNWFETPIRF